MPDNFWKKVGPEATLAQGDHLVKIPVPQFEGIEHDEVVFINVDAIIVTQSCDIENDKTKFIAFCPIHSMDKFVKADPNFSSKKELLRQCKIEAVHMLSGFEDVQKNEDVFIVDFRQVYSLPITFVEKHVAEQGERHRLKSPFLERFAQCFGRCYMRVGLPFEIAKF